MLTFIPNYNFPLWFEFVFLVYCYANSFKIRGLIFFDCSAVGVWRPSIAMGTTRSGTGTQNRETWTPTRGCLQGC